MKALVYHGTGKQAYDTFGNAMRQGALKVIISTDQAARLRAVPAADAMAAPKPNSITKGAAVVTA